MDLLRKISAVLMALFILLISAGFVLHKHRCNVANKTITSVTHVKKCCGVDNTKGCPKGCCQDKTEYIRFNAKKSLPATTHAITPEQSVAVVRYGAVNDLFNRECNTSTEYLNYRPPLLLRDIPVLVQSFLI